VTLLPTAFTKILLAVSALPQIASQLVGGDAQLLCLRQTIYGTFKGELEHGDINEEFGI